MELYKQALQDAKNELAQVTAISDARYAEIGRLEMQLAEMRNAQQRGYTIQGHLVRLVDALKQRVGQFK